MDRATVSKLERGLRQTLTVGELLVLAAAVEVPPIELLFPVDQAEQVEVLPADFRGSWAGVMLFTGESGYPGNSAAVELLRQHEQLVYHARRYMKEAQPADWRDKAFSQMAESGALQALVQVRQAMTDRGYSPPPWPDDIPPA
jgi:hypothetical protein